MDQLQMHMLKKVADLHSVPEGAYNIRDNGTLAGRNTTANIDIISKEDKPGIDIVIKPGTKNESVHIPVIVSQSGLKDLVYNDFYIGEDADVVIVAGCGIHCGGSEDTEHDGIHTFHIGKNAKVSYVEKHLGEGKGSGERILNPTTIVHMEEGSYMEMDTSQIKGVNSTKRKTTCYLQAHAKLVISERLMTHDAQRADSDVVVSLDGEDSVVQIVSRSVGKDDSVQVFHPIAIGNAPCRAHIQCDSILMDHAKISSIPEISANHVEAQIVHEAAIGKINNDQLMKLQTFGLSAEEAEQVIVEGFLK